MSSTPKILVIDDEERFRTTLGKLLKARGLDVVTVGRAMDALEELENRPYDVIILDIRMPEMNGIEALSAIKKIQPEVEVITLTGHASVDVAVEIMKLGGYDHLLKPCPVEELIERIDAAYERKKVREASFRRTEVKEESR